MVMRPRASRPSLTMSAPPTSGESQQDQRECRDLSHAAHPGAKSAEIPVPTLARRACPRAAARSYGHLFTAEPGSRLRDEALNHCQWQSALGIAAEGPLAGVVVAVSVQDHAATWRWGDVVEFCRQPGWVAGNGRLVPAPFDEPVVASCGHGSTLAPARSRTRLPSASFAMSTYRGLHAAPGGRSSRAASMRWAGGAGGVQREAASTLEDVPSLVELRWRSGVNLTRRL
jgi:hypothetical protein